MWWCRARTSHAQRTRAPDTMRGRASLMAPLRVVDPLLERTVRSAIPCSGSVGGHRDHRYHQEGRRRSWLRLHRRRRHEGILLPSQLARSRSTSTASSAASASRSRSRRAPRGLAPATSAQPDFDQGSPPLDGLPTGAPDVPSSSLLRVDGPSGALDVWLGCDGDASALEADVRAVSARGIREMPALAMALGDVARLHKLEVRVIPRFDPTGHTVLVLFGRRTQRASSPRGRP